MPVLEKACQDRGVTILTETLANKILTTDVGAACGVVATGKNGETVTVNAKAVVLATGGFGANLDMVGEYKPELAGFMTTNAAGAQGQGITMAKAVGADTVDMDQIQIHPTVEANTAALITEGLRGDGAILVNADGKRFTDEVGTRDVVSAAEIAQPGSYSWLIVDQKMVDASSVIAGYIKKGYIKVTAGVHHTMGGLKIDTVAEVLTQHDEVIPGLFAAGEVTGGVHGANRLGGNAVADFVVFGRIAGNSAVEYVNK